ncbi:MAG: DUF4156 domain-containing protein [Pseudohongiellaceae bacterium]
MSSNHIAIAALLLTASLAGCRTEWVQLTPEGEQVSLATPSEVSECRRLGSTTVNGADSIGFMQRSARQLQNELVRLARNEAGLMEGNRVVPESTIEDGRQTFGVHRCP